MKIPKEIIYLIITEIFCLLLLVFWFFKFSVEFGLIPTIILFSLLFFIGYLVRGWGVMA